MQTKQKKVMIMAGGTGGHIFPALAVANALIKDGYTVEWLGAHGMETQIVPDNNIKLHSLNIKGLRRNGLLGYVTLPFRLANTILKARKILKHFDPCYVIGFGGFACAPGGFAAFINRIPLMIHEQNTVAGLTNKVLARLSKHVLSGFPCNLPNCNVVGNPVRETLFLKPPKERFNQEKDNFSLNILVMGGSQGARKINQIIPEAMVLLKKEKEINLSIWHQTGKHFFDEAKEQWQTHNKASEVKIIESVIIESFIGDMKKAYEWADLVICRAGASTISEITVTGVASILIPLPSAVDDHQTQNAHYLSNQKAAILLPEKELTAIFLAETIATLDRHQCLDIAQKAYQLAQKEAVNKIKKLIDQD